jgi:hypothetical protein
VRWAVFSLAYAGLGEALVIFEASFDTAAAGGVWDQPEDAADDALGGLLSRRMVIYYRHSSAGACMA